MVWYGLVWCSYNVQWGNGTAQNGLVWHGACTDLTTDRGEMIQLVWYGMLEYGTVWYSYNVQWGNDTAWYGMVLNSRVSVEMVRL